LICQDYILIDNFKISDIVISIMPISTLSILSDTRPQGDPEYIRSEERQGIPRTDNKPVAYNHGRRYLSKRSYKPARFRDNISHVEELNPFYTL